MRFLSIETNAFKSSNYQHSTLAHLIMSYHVTYKYSVSQDTTLKAWKIDYDTDTMSSVRTEIAHEKVNPVASTVFLIF